MVSPPFPSYRELWGVVCWPCRLDERSSLTLFRKSRQRGSDQRGRRGRSSSRQRLAAAYWLLPVRSFPRPLCRLGTARRRSSRRALGMTPPCRAIELECPYRTRSEEHTLNSSH